MIGHDHTFTTSDKRRITLSQQKTSIKLSLYFILRNVPVDKEVFFSPCPNQYTP